MSHRKIDLTLTGKCLDGDTRFTNPAARKQWSQQFDGELFTCTFKLIGSLDDKRRLFAFLFGPLLTTVLSHFEEAGYQFANTKDIYNDFKSMFGQYMRVNKITGKEEVAIYDYSSDDVSVDLLKKFLDEVIAYCEQTFDNFVCPDSEAYRVKKKYGANFKPASTFKQQGNERS